MLAGHFDGSGVVMVFGSGVLWMLNNAWGSAVAKLTIYYAPRLESVVLGTGASFLIGLVCLFWINRKQRKYCPIELIQLMLTKPTLFVQNLKRKSISRVYGLSSLLG